MAKTTVQDRLATIGNMVDSRLERMGDLIEPVKPPRTQPTFGEYHARAQSYMQQHPEDQQFKAAFDQAMAQYRAAGGK